MGRQLPIRNASIHTRRSRAAPTRRGTSVPSIIPRASSTSAPPHRRNAAGAIRCDVIRESANSPDVAGAYCVLGYQLLEAPRPDSYFIRVWLSEVDACLRAQLDDEPATVRWRVSLLFLAGRLAMRHANNALALRSFQACMSEDAARSLVATRDEDDRSGVLGRGCCARATATAMRLENRGHGVSRSRRAASGSKPNRHAIWASRWSCLASASPRTSSTSREDAQQGLQRWQKVRDGSNASLRCCRNRRSRWAGPLAVKGVTLGIGRRALACA